MTTDFSSRGNTSAWLCNALQLLARRFGHEIPARQEVMIEEVILRLTSEFGVGSPEECLGMLRTLPVDAPLVQGLLCAVTNKESYFFRDHATMDSLRETILPALIERAAASRSFRVWSAGCSSGEEIYTISILLHELLPHYDSWSVSLIGTDIDHNAISHARAAEYRQWSLRVADEHARRRYFDELKSERFCLKPKYRANVSFQAHNLADAEWTPPSPGRFDLILCRNVTIYFSQKAQADVAAKFAAALAPGGVWLSGPSDPTPRSGFSTRVLPGVLEHRLATSTTRTDATSVVPVAPREPNAPAKPPFAGEAGDAKPPVAPVPVRRGFELNLRSGQAPSELIAEIRYLADAGRNSEALERVSKTISRYPLSAEPYLLRAMLEEASSEYELACADLRRVLYIAPNHLEAGLRLGLLLARRGEKAAAFATLRAVISMRRSEDPEIEALRVVAARHLVRLIQSELKP